MLEIALTIISTLLLIWPIKKVATWMGAGKDSYGAVVFALILSFVLSLIAALISIPLASLGILGFVIIGIIFILANAYAFSKALATSLLKGFGIVLIGSLLGSIIMAVFVFVFGVGMVYLPYNDEVSAAAFESISEEVCKCGTDESCLEERMISLARLAIAAQDVNFDADESSRIQRSTERAQLCMVEPEEYVAPESRASSSLSTAEILGEEATNKQPEVVAEPVKKAVYAWRKSSVEALPQLTGRHVKITTTEDLDRSGKIEKIEDDNVYVMKSKNVSYTVPVHMIKIIEVYEQVE